MAACSRVKRSQRRSPPSSLRSRSPARGSRGEGAAGAAPAVTPAMGAAGPGFAVPGGGSPAPPFLVADFGGNSALVLGGECSGAEWKALDLASHPIVVRKNGAEAAKG